MTPSRDAEHSSVIALRECLHAHAGDHEALRAAILRCATEARGHVPPDVLIKVVREELPALAQHHKFDYLAAKDTLVEWLLAAYFGPDSDARNSFRDEL